MELEKSKMNIDTGVSNVGKMTEMFQNNPKGTIATLAVSAAAVGVATIKIIGKAIDALSKK